MEFIRLRKTLIMSSTEGKELTGVISLCSLTKSIASHRNVSLDVSKYKKGEGEPTNTLIASGTIQHTSTQTLTNYFSKYGKVVSVRRSTETQSKFTRWAFIQFGDCNSVEKALSDDKHLIGNELVDCRRYLSKAPPKRHISNFPLKKSDQRESSISEDNIGVTKLCVHGMALTTTTKMMSDYFSKFATVLDAYVPTVYGTKRSKGFGYIVIATSESNFDFNDHVIDGNLVRITLEKGNKTVMKSSTLLISAGPPIMAKISEDDLAKFFSRFGKVKSVRKKTDPATKQFSHYAFVQFASCDSVEKALGESLSVLNRIKSHFFLL